MPFVKQSVVKNHSSAGTIDNNADFVSIDGASALAMVLIAPDTVSENGKTMVIVSSTAQAHTVTYTGGFSGIGTGADVATFGGAKGDSMSIVFIDGIWHVTALNNVTLA